MCEILAINLVGDIKDEETVSVVTPKEMEVARGIWARGVKSENQLRRVKIPALLGLCAEHNIVLPTRIGRRLRRSEITEALIVSFAYRSQSTY
jgi:hypothetical protein